MFLETLFAQGFLVRCPGVRKNCRVFLIPKSSDKVSMIADLRWVNTMSPSPMPTFILPTVGAVFTFVAGFPPLVLWGATLDLTNFFWILRLPDEFCGVFRVDGGFWDALPFGWNLSPLVAQMTLTRVLQGALHFAGTKWGEEWGLGGFVYLDAVLILGVGKERVVEVVRVLVEEIRARRLILSKKSVLQPTGRVKWLGKWFDLGARSVENWTPTLVRLLTGVVFACMAPMRVKQLDGLMGLVNWTFQPRPGFGLFAAGLYDFKDRLRGTRCCP